MAGMEAYLRAHEAKKWHDPTAAACHLHPEIGTVRLVWMADGPCAGSGDPKDGGAYRHVA